MEADWQEVYGVDLAVAVHGGMSARRVSALTLALPQTSRTMRAVGGDESPWTHDRVLLGLVVERLDALHASFVKANGGKAKAPAPIVPRPKRQRTAPVATVSVLAGLDRALAAAGGDG